MIHLSNLHYAYHASSFQLDIPDLRLTQGEKVAIVGPSGSGKSTLLALISGALTPQSGTVVVDGTDLRTLGEAARRLFRASRIGLVFQEFELIEYLSVEENIRLPYLINRRLNFSADQRTHLLQLVKQTGLDGKLKSFPNQLSQGEKQRVAICRALITKPRLLLADEPTGSLDPKTATSIMQLFMEQVSVCNATLLMVTHDHGMLKFMDRAIDMSEMLFTGQTLQQIVATGEKK